MDVNKKYVQVKRSFVETKIIVSRGKYFVARNMTHRTYLYFIIREDSFYHICLKKSIFHSSNLQEERVCTIVKDFSYYEEQMITKS